MLTDAVIKATKAGDKARKLYDERGLYLLIKPAREGGSKLWRFKYHWAGKEKLLAFGDYRDVSLAVARDKRAEARRLLAGRPPVDPGAERKEAKAVQAAQGRTFAVVAVAFLQAQLKGGAISQDTHDYNLGRLQVNFFPSIGGRPMGALETRDLLAPLKRIEERGQLETAHRMRSLLGRICRYGVANEDCQRDITVELRGALAPNKTAHFPGITEPRRVGELLRAVWSYAGQPSTEYAQKLESYTFVRSSELRFAEWREFDLDARIWRIPAERMKIKVEHIVPLADQAMVLLEELRPLTGGGALLFPGLRPATKPISDVTLNAALRRMGFSSEEHTTHGWRTTASTLLNEMGYNADWIEAQLAHVPENETRASYNQAKWLYDPRRPGQPGPRFQMMQAYADYLDQLRTSNVVQLRAA